MEEMRNEEIEVMEGLELEEVLDSDTMEEIQEDGNGLTIALSAIIIGGAITGIGFGIKKFLDWRKSKKQFSETTIEESVCQENINE